MSQKKKKKPVTVADLSKTSSARGSSRKAAPKAPLAAEAARSAYRFVSAAKSKSDASGTRTFVDGLCRIPLVRTARNVVQTARGAVETAQRLGVLVRDRLLQTVLERFA